MPRDLSGLVVPQRGWLEATGDLFVPYRLVGVDGAVVVSAAAFFAELAACGRPATTQRSYGMDLLRWFRFLWALGLDWDQATQVEARDFCRWLQVPTEHDTHRRVSVHSARKAGYSCRQAWHHRGRRPAARRPGAGPRGASVGQNSAPPSPPPHGHSRRPVGQ
jgi:hypothetical protein